MVFKFKHYHTLDNNEATHELEVLPGKYTPSCEVMGSVPTASIRILMGDQMMQGRVEDIDNKMGTQFVAEATEFRGQ